MIAPFREVDTEIAESPGRSSGVRQIVAAMLERKRPPEDTPPPMPAWRAWMFAGWVVVVTAVYFATMMGLL